MSRIGNYLVISEKEENRYRGRRRIRGRNVFRRQRRNLHSSVTDAHTVKEAPSLFFFFCETRFRSQSPGWDER